MSLPSALLFETCKQFPMASSFHICLSFLALFLFSFDISYAAETKPQTIIFPIRKSTSALNPSYMQSLIRLLWFDCESGYTSSSYRPISCDSKRCIQAKGSAAWVVTWPLGQGAPTTRGVYPYNPSMNILAGEGLGHDVISVSQTDGKVYLLSANIPHFQFSCHIHFN